MGEQRDIADRKALVTLPCITRFYETGELTIEQVADQLIGLGVAIWAHLALDDDDE